MELQTRKRPNRLKSYTWLLLAAAIVAACVVVYLALNLFIRPGLVQYAQTRIQATATDAIYGAIYNSLNDETLELVTILRSDDGQVQYIEMNSRVLGKLGAVVADDVQTTINSVGKQGIDIPFGTASGFPLLAGSGPQLRMTFHVEGTSQVEFSSEFRSAGINQTLHRVHMHVQTDIAMVLPGIAQNVMTNVNMTVAEHIIVGTVPDVYANTDSPNSILDLIP